MQTLTQTSGEELVERLQARDNDALDELLEQYGGQMYKTARRFVRNETSAQEVVQDVLISVWNRIDTFQGRASFTSWLHRVTVNAALMRLRAARRNQRFVSFEDWTMTPVDPRPVRPDSRMLHRELGEVVRTAIDGLPEPSRTIVMLADADGVGVPEIAKLLGSSEAAVKSRLHRARLVLRRKLLPYLQARAHMA